LALARKLPFFEKEGAAHAIKVRFTPAADLRARLLAGSRFAKNFRESKQGAVPGLTLNGGLRDF
jgi:hypothetical protein